LVALGAPEEILVVPEEIINQEEMDLQSTTTSAAVTSTKPVSKAFAAP